MTADLFKNKYNLEIYHLLFIVLKLKLKKQN